MTIRPLIILLPAVFLSMGFPALLPAAGGADFDRFFTAKKTRMQLDQAREQYKFISPRGNNASIEESQQLVLPDVKVDGMIIRRDGSTQVWVNSAVSANSGDLGNKVERSARRTKDGRVRLTLPSGEIVNLKPGQVYSMETERVREAYEEIHEEPVAENENQQKPENGEVPEKTQSEDKQAAAFDEAALAKDQDAKIKLLEERVHKLEHVSNSGNESAGK